MKKAFVWFWARTRMPQRLWKKCMEFSIKNKAGIVEKHYIDPLTGTAHKVNILLDVSIGRGLKKTKMEKS